MFFINVLRMISVTIRPYIVTNNIWNVYIKTTYKKKNYITDLI